ncbi:right-handed parallel beta-helix repeat-containing protein [Streptomyces cyaneofuscatus]|uniref:right-handed parallel beta-helix repeat-containing protein n=1 Tax=Streptomyces cyaneofuscatus TaxID=66883 RepID=UPI0037F75DF4
MLYTFGGNPAAVLTNTAGDVVPDYPVNIRRGGSGEPVTALYEADGTTPIGQLRSNPSGHAQPGAIRRFRIEDVREIEYQYLDTNGAPVTWYESAREIAPTALDASAAATTTAGTAQTAAAAAVATAGAAAAAAAAAQATADDALTNASMPGWYSVSGAAADGVSDDFSAIQGALDAARDAGGGTVLIPPGDYACGAALCAYDDTTIYAYGATIKAIGGGGLLHNYANTSESWAGYEGRSNIAVLGGTWDGNAGTGPGQTSGLHDVISFNHARNILVQDVTVLNTSQAHALEFNAIDGGRAINCRFLGFADLSSGGTRQFSEALQIDIAVSGSTAVGLFDNTPSKNIEVIGCITGPSDTLGPFGRFVGSHTIRANTYYDNITIRGNVVEGALSEGIRGYGWRRAVIADNVIRSTGKAGITLTVPDPATAGYALNPDQVVIANNIIDGPGGESGIRVLGFATAKHSGVRITGNTINGRSTGGANGIQVEHCKGPGIVGNTVDASGSTGIYVNQSSDALVSGSTVTASGSNAINITDSPGANVAANTIGGTVSNYGVAVLNSDSVSITGNSIARTTLAGIRLSTGATRAVVVGNQVRKGGAATPAGITLDASATGATILDNDLSGNSWSASTALGVSTASPTTGPGGTTALPGSNTVDTDLTALPALEAAMRPAGRYETTSRLRCGTAVTPTSGVLYLVPIWLPAGLVISNIAFVSGTNAAVTPTNYWFSLHDSARVALARTADQGSAAWGTNTVKSLAIAQSTAGSASSYTTPYRGLYYLGVMITASTLPNLIGEGAVPAVSAVAPGLGPTNTGQTTPPTVTAGAFTAAAFTGGSALLSYAYVT